MNEKSLFFQKSLKPALMGDFCNNQIFVRVINCGAFHNAAITSSGELYTWGSNVNGCLGRLIEEKGMSFTPQPGVCSSFGVIVNRIGRGLPRSIACGKEFTVVATYSYEGPTEAKAQQLTQKKKQQDSKSRQETATRKKKLCQREENEIKKQQQLQDIKFLTSKRLCTLEPKCPGKF